MLLDNRPVHLLFALLALPLQVMISRYLFTGNLHGASSANRDAVVKDIVESVSRFKSHVFSLGTWRKLCSNAWDWLLGANTLTVQLEQTDQQVDPKVSSSPEDISKEFFGGSTKPRTDRSSAVKLYVGQVVRHIKFKYKGVVVAWDAQGRAPDNWFKRMYPADKLQKWRSQPTFRVLIDTRDRPIPQLVYVPQENLEPLHGTSVQHPLVNEYFEHFDGSVYIPRPWLQRVYPYG